MNTNQIDETSLEKEKEELWNTTGFHRPLGGFFYNYIFLLILLIPGLLVLGVVIPAILPYPEALGYNSIITQLLNVFFIFADFGLVEATTRYVSENSTTNPKKSLQYISFFIWFQMITGLLQITFVSMYVMTWLPYTDLNYASWFFLVYIMIQWPGTALTFGIALKSFQNFNRETIVNIFQNVAIQTLTQVGFILLGRWWGSQNPEIGELMGAVIGFIFGSYLDDLIGFVLGAYLFKKTIKPFGFSFKETLLLDFDKGLVKEVLSFGFKVLPSRMGFYASNFVITMMITSWLYNYSTLAGLYSIAFAITRLLEVSFSIGPPIAEAYNNDKKHLARYTIEEQFRWWGIIVIGMLTVPLIIFIPALLPLVGGEYGEASFMIFLLFFSAVFTFPSDFTGEIARNANMPGTSTILETIKQGIRVIAFLIALAPWGIATWFGREYVVIAWLLADVPGIILKLILGWIVVNKRIVQIKFPFVQTVLIPAIATIPLILFSIAIIGLLNVLVEVSMIVVYGIAVLVLLGYLFFLPALFTFPIIGFLGGFDKRSLEHFENAVKISGPSHFLANLMYKSSLFGYKHSPFKDKFLIDHEAADAEAIELTVLRKKFVIKENGYDL